MSNPGRVYDVSRFTTEELRQARKDLALSLSMSAADSNVRVPISAQMNAVDAELVIRGCREGTADPGFRWL